MKTQGEVEQLSAVYSELFHYTTAAGLEGIVSKQSLRATHYEYMNDKGEFNGFFHDRLPLILQQCFKEAEATLKTSSKFGSNLKELINSLPELIRTASQKVYEPHIISFCGVPNGHMNDDGLLSQWRAYGHDGGYVVVFDTRAIEDMLHAENEQFHYFYMQFGDVDYHEESTQSKLTEMHNYETEIKSAFINYLQSGDIRDFESANPAIIAMATTHKHPGFKEEAEVRIVCAPVPHKYRDLGPDGKVKKIKPCCFHNREGLLVPYITLFDESKIKAKLPITKVIIGPHPDSARRRKSVIKLLERYEVEAEVVCSKIPYHGKQHNK